ncbi:MAG: hypothetical protein IKZ49_02445 [Alphaproteobacteria bacterium]|nr:hypothetical protein [Alphaproteobacteria bacterium]
MNILMGDIFDFYELRISCHIKSMNYFADILGYHFPEHDRDKVVEPIRTGYAYVFYNTYHKNFHLTPEHEALCKDARRLHHEHASHHIQAYNNVSEIPDICIYEMIADWSSANFEQMNIIKDKDAISIEEWFDKNMSSLGWTEHQLEIIKNSFEKIAKTTDEETITKIWLPLLEKADL